MDLLEKKPSILMVEGNVGAGKSTFLKIIQKKLKIDVIYEPTNKWQNKNEDENLLHLFYKDTPRWAYTFQSYAFISRVQSIIDYQASHKSSPLQILERSVYCDRYCFAKNCFESGLMTQLEWQIYKEWFTWLVERYTPRPSGFIYLKTTPEICFKRLTKRNRSEEAGVPLSYLQELHRRHEDWLIGQKELTPFLATVPVLTIDCTQEFESNERVQEEQMNAIQDFIDTKVMVQTPASKLPHTQLSA